jgi:hypothetical protein
MRRNGIVTSVVMSALIAFSVGCSQPVSARERANSAWSERLNQQAQSVAQETARRERAEAAYRQRLTEQAAAYQAEKTNSERAKQAWSDRLTKLAEYLQDGGGMLGPDR